MESLNYKKEADDMNILLALALLGIGAIIGFLVAVYMLARSGDG